MRKTQRHFEQVPVAVVEKILELQSSLDKPAGNRKRVVKKSGRAPTGLHVVSKKAEVLVP